MTEARDARRRFRAAGVVALALAAVLAAWYLASAGSKPAPGPGVPPADSTAQAATSPPAVRATPPPPGAPAQPAGDAADADAAAVHAAIARIATEASACRSGSDPSGTAYVTVKVEAPGRVKYAKVTLDPYAGTPTARCIESKMLDARLPGFRGDELTLTQVVKIR